MSTIKYSILGFIMVAIMMLFMACKPPTHTGNTAPKAKESIVMKQVKGNKTSAMNKALDDFIQKEPLLKGALIGVSIRSAETGDKWYDYMGDTRLRPASNMKLVTAAAALKTLGKDYTFSTELKTDGSVEQKKLLGSLYLQGKGDPTLLPDDFDTFAKELHEQGIETVDGDIIGDDSWYDNVRLSPDLIWEDEQYYYGAQISALTASPDDDYDAGTVIVEVSPGENAGEKPVISITPETDYIQIENKAETVIDGEDDIMVERKHGTNQITVNGEIPADSRDVREWIAVWEPTNYALDLFQQALKNNGISWTGNVKTGQAPSGVTSILSHQSMPLSELLVLFMKLSNNTHAETLVKEMGKVEHGEGSWEKGLEVVETCAEDRNIDLDTTLIRDGSGISHVNLIPSNELSKLLYQVQDEDWFSTYVDALPVAGEEERITGGTLRDRLGHLEGSIRAKTGSIYGVSTLSGYMETKKGEKLIFSIMLNNLLDEEEGPDIEDKLIDIMAAGGWDE